MAEPASATALKRLELELLRLEGLMGLPVRTAKDLTLADAYERRLRVIDNQVRLIRTELEHLKATMP